MNPPSDLYPAAIRRRLHAVHFGRAALRVVNSIGSTNAQLLAAANDTPHGAVLIADRQTAGRGRKQREWWSQPGKDLLLSILLRPAVSPTQLATLVYAAGLAACETISRALGRAAGLKWPNDVYVDRRKICGILCQTEFLAPPAVVVGFGVNVNSSAAARPPEQHAVAVSLFDLDGVRRDRAELAAALLDEFETQYSRWLDDPSATLRVWEERARLAGRRVRVRDERGEYEAEAIGIDDAGRLLVAAGDERRPIIGGDLDWAED